MGGPRARPVIGAFCALLAIAGCDDQERRLPSAAAPPATADELALAAPTRTASPRKPTIIRKPIPYGAKRKAQMSAYSQRHYGVAGYRLTDPRVIVAHFTVNDSVQATYDTFAANVRDPELGELPGVCSHFVIGKDGRIYQLVSQAIRCRHTVGLNDRSLGIEHVGRSDRQILNNRRQLTASLRLAAWLRCRHDIGVRNVIGHNESLSSPYHHENVEQLKTQTHADFKKAAMRVYRRKLRERRC